MRSTMRSAPNFRAWRPRTQERVSDHWPRLILVKRGLKKFRPTTSTVPPCRTVASRRRAWPGQQPQSRGHRPAGRHGAGGGTKLLQPSLHQYQARPVVRSSFLGARPPRPEVWRGPHRRSHRKLLPRQLLRQLYVQQPGELRPQPGRNGPEGARRCLLSTGLRRHGNNGADYQPEYSGALGVRPGRMARAQQLDPDFRSALRHPTEGPADGPEPGGAGGGARYRPNSQRPQGFRSPLRVCLDATCQQPPRCPRRLWDLLRPHSLHHGGHWAFEQRPERGYAELLRFSHPAIPEQYLRRTGFLRCITLLRTALGWILESAHHLHIFSGLCATAGAAGRSEEHTSELQSRSDLVCRLLLEKKKKKYYILLNHD